MRRAIFVIAPHVLVGIRRLLVAPTGVSVISAALRQHLVIVGLLAHSANVQANRVSGTNAVNRANER